jgi:hypothetical protein
LILLIIGSIINHTIKLNGYSQHLKNKYSLRGRDIRLLSYEKEHTVRISAGMFSSSKRTVPHIITYEVNGRIVKVVDNGTIILDDYQMKEISYIAAEYFSELLGYHVEFVEFNSNSKYGNGYSDALSNYVQTKNNSFVSLKNIEEFLIGYKNFDPYLFTSVNLYVNLTDCDDIYTLINDIDRKLTPFIERTHLNNLGIWLYSGNGEELTIIKSSLRNDKDYPDDFSTYYVDNLENILAYIDNSNRYDNFKRIGNFNVDDRGLWFFGR